TGVLEGQQGESQDGMPIPMPLRLPTHGRAAALERSTEWTPVNRPVSGPAARSTCRGLRLLRGIDWGPVIGRHTPGRTTQLLRRITPCCPVEGRAKAGAGAAAASPRADCDQPCAVAPRASRG